jgi:hypothetical protein
MENLKEIVVRLRRCECRFVVVGGFGAVSWGGSLLTRDVDAACDMSPENLRQVWHALEGLNPVHRMTPERFPYQCHVPEGSISGFKSSVRPSEDSRQA